jgi:Type I phosphodiesterase / nucleotide pyrophosphatase
VPRHFSSRKSLFLSLAGLLVVAIIVAVVLPRGSAEPTPPGPPVPTDVSSQALAKQVCRSVDPVVLERVYNGTYPGRSGDIQLIPHEPNFVDGGLTHASPFELTQHVPLLLYGPGYVRPGVYDRPAHLTDISQTASALVKFDGFHAPDGRALEEGLLPASDRPMPRLVVTLIWDSAGMDLLNRWPNAWPTLAAMRKQGAWFSHATVGASPSNTPPSHATIGTGAYPREHGMTDEYEMIDGELVKPNDDGPGAMLEPTFADVYDAAEGNQPIVGELGSLSAHIMMMGHGLQYQGGDADIAVAREVPNAETAGDDAGSSWSLTDAMAPYYTFPTYANDPKVEAVFDEAKQELDQSDGKLDGDWRNQSIEGMREGFNTPARTPYQTALFEEVIRREGFGQDDVPDLLYLNYKMIDTLGHQFSADGVELSDALKVQDDNLRTFVRFLNEQVGRGKWVMLLTADHGMQRDPKVTGAYPIDIDDLEAAVDSTFGDHVVIKARPTQMWLDEDELSANGFTLDEVSAFLRSLTEADTVGAIQPDPGHEDDKVFDAVFPSSLLDHLSCLPGAADTQGG